MKSSFLFSLNAGIFYNQQTVGSLHFSDYIFRLDLDSPAKINTNYIQSLMILKHLLYLHLEMIWIRFNSQMCFFLELIYFLCQFYLRVSTKIQIKFCQNQTIHNISKKNLVVKNFSQLQFPLSFLQKSTSIIFSKKCLFQTLIYVRILFSQVIILSLL